MTLKQWMYLFRWILEKWRHLGHQKMYLDSKGKPIKNKSLTGIDASGVPGFVDGVIFAHQK